MGRKAKNPITEEHKKASGTKIKKEEQYFEREPYKSILESLNKAEGKCLTLTELRYILSEQLILKLHNRFKGRDLDKIRTTTSKFNYTSGAFNWFLTELRKKELIKKKGKLYYLENQEKTSKNFLLQKLKEIQNVKFKDEITYFNCEEIIPEIENKAKEIKKLWIKYSLQKIAEIIPEFLREFKTEKDKCFALCLINKIAKQQIEFLKENPNNFSEEIDNLYLKEEKFDVKIKEEFENMCKIYQEVGTKMNNAFRNKELMIRVDEERGKRMKDFYKIKKEQYKREKRNGENVYPQSIFRKMTNEELKMTDYLYVISEFMLKDGMITKKEFKVRWEIYDFIEIIREKSGKFQELKFLFEINFPLIVINLGYI